MIDMAANLERRYKREQRFRRLGLMVVLLTIAFLLIMLTAISIKGLPAFQHTRILLDLDLSDASYADPQTADYQQAINRALQAVFPEVTERAEWRKLKSMVSRGAQFNLRDRFLDVPPSERIGVHKRVPVVADDLVDLVVKGAIDRQLPEDSRVVDDRKIAWLDALAERGMMDTAFNSHFFTHGTSREPEQAGILVALVSSLITLVITFVLTFPIGIASAIYLEEFAPRNRFTDFIGVNISNLAAVPSIIFGLLGLAIFINFFGVPRSTPLVGGLVLALMTLPTIIIASRAAIKAVPPSIRDAALALGASRMQVVLHHVLPLSMPGMLTGETAPLLIIGMVAFVVEMPTSALDPATALPVQIFLWAGNPEHSFVNLAAAAIMVLLGVLLSINILAVYLRKRFERKW